MGSSPGGGDFEFSEELWRKGRLVVELTVGEVLGGRYLVLLKVKKDCMID